MTHEQMPAFTLRGEPVSVRGIAGNRITIHTRLRLCPDSRHTLRSGADIIQSSVASSAVVAVSPCEVTYQTDLQVDFEQLRGFAGAMAHSTAAEPGSAVLA
jgi:hypothetical protein